MNTTQAIINKIFKNHEQSLLMFDDPVSKLDIYEKDEGKYYLKSISKMEEEKLVYNEKTGKSAPEEIVRQLYLSELTKKYKYPKSHIEIEKIVQFGREKNDNKRADIVVYTDDSWQTIKMIIEVKAPDAENDIQQLKSYLNAEGSPIGVALNGKYQLILFRPYPKDFDTLDQIPAYGEDVADVLQKRKTLKDLHEQDLKIIIKTLEELVLAFVQYIPYDYSKNSPENIIVNYPYETLYKQKGVCSDKSFLAALLLRKMGYGSVILDLPEANHTAIGIQCPVADSTYGSGYCFVETTNYFPIGTLPQSINSGQANSNNIIDNIFNTSHLGKVEYYQKTFGSLYYGITNTKNQVALIKSLKAIINNDAPELKRIKNEIDLAAENLVNLKKQLEQYRTNGDWIGYNNFTVTYNAEVVKYNAQLEAYQVLADLYNTNINKYNQTQKELFQN